MRVPPWAVVAAAVIAAFPFGWGLGVTSAYLIAGHDFGQLPALTVPLSIVGDLPHAVAEIRKHEAELIALCRDPDFSFEKLEEALRAARNWSPKPEVR